MNHPVFNKLTQEPDFRARVKTVAKLAENDHLAGLFAERYGDNEFVGFSEVIDLGKPNIPERILQLISPSDLDTADVLLIGRALEFPMRIEDAVTPTCADLAVYAELAAQNPKLVWGTVTVPIFGGAVMGLMRQHSERTFDPTVFDTLTEDSAPQVVQEHLGTAGLNWIILDLDVDTNRLPKVMELFA